MSETIIVAVITALATSLPTIIATRQSLKNKELEYRNQIQLSIFDKFHSHYIDYIHSVFNYTYVQTVETETTYRECHAILRTYTDFIHIELLDKIDDLLAKESFDEALDLLYHLGKCINILSKPL